MKNVKLYINHLFSKDVSSIMINYLTFECKTCDTNIFMFTSNDIIICPTCKIEFCTNCKLQKRCCQGKSCSQDFIKYCKKCFM